MNPCQLFACSLAGMKYYTKAGEGIGESWYRHLDALPIYGMGQGSCALPVVWTLISVVLINTLCKLHKGMTFTTPDGKINTERPIEGLINDTTIGTNTAGNNSSCLSKVQELTKSWEHFLFLSGGMLARDKCFYYHIDWEWNEGKAQMIDPPGSNIDRSRKDQEPDRPISRKLKEESHRTLRVRISPDGS